MKVASARVPQWLGLLAALAVGAATACGPEARLGASEAGPDFPLQGEYAVAGAPRAAQVIALGDGRFRLVWLEGGLPGAGWDGRARKEVPGRREGDAVAFEDGSRIEGGSLRGTSDAIPLPRIVRQSPTLGAPPPPGAVVIFGEGVNRTDGEVDERGLLAAGATSLAAFRDVLLHVEFLVPFMPDADAQSRGNSGVYLQNRYEVQILDSFGLRAEANGCGALYEVAAPAVNMALPPLAWQTYDIDFRAARFDAEGRPSEPARVSVRHNGVVIHEGLVLEGPTGAGDDVTPEPGPLYLQDHWDPVYFRNVWLLER